MHDFVRGCAARSVGRVRNPLLIPGFAFPSGLPATSWCFRTDVAPQQQRPPATFLAPQTDPSAIANVSAPLGRSRCPVFDVREIHVLSPQTHVAGKSAR